MMFDGKHSEGGGEVGGWESAHGEVPPDPDEGFGAWAPGVFESFIGIVLEERGSTSAGAIVGRTFEGRPRIDGVITTVRRGQVGSVAFDRTSWGWVHEVRGSRYPESAVAGWFCARPGIAAVPTEVDVATHRQFFPGGDHVLICVDPLSLEVAAYRGVDGQMRSIGRGDLNALSNFSPIEPGPVWISAEAVAAGMIGLIIGAASWLVAGSGGWPFG